MVKCPHCGSRVTWSRSIYMYKEYTIAKPKTEERREIQKYMMIKKGYEVRGRTR